MQLLGASTSEQRRGRLVDLKDFVDVSSQNVVLTGVKKAEDDSALIVRFYEWSGKEGDVKVDLSAGADSGRN
jgi:alpha-mannosidase